MYILALRVVVKDGGDASETSSVVANGGASDVGCSEPDLSSTGRGSAKGSAPSTPPQVI